MKVNHQFMEKFSNSNSFKIVIFLVIVGFLIRLVFIPFEIPLSLDALDYFAYSVAINQEGNFPDEYLVSNFGWSSILSLSFWNSNNSEMLELMNIERIFSSIISSITVIPIYLLCKNFFKKNIAVLGSSLFLFDPRIIENSILGISDSIYILFVVITIMFVFIKNRRFFYISFVFAALATFVRYEGVLLIFPLILSFFLRRNFDKKSISKFIIGISLFFAILFIINETAYENSNIFSSVFGSTNYVSNVIFSDEVDPDDQFYGNNDQNKIQIFLNNLSIGYLKYLGWILIPVLGLFVIPGFFMTKKKFSKNKIILLMFFAFISFTGLYAYGRGIQETRYLYPLIPILILFSCQFFDFLTQKFDTKKIMMVSISTIIILSVIFIEYDKIDYVYENEIYHATVFVTSISEGVNDYYGNKFVRTAALENSWPKLLPTNEKHKMTANIKKFSSEGFETVEQFLEGNKNKGLTHLVIVENDKKLFLKKIFHNENEYSFLEKIYDSKDLGFKNQIKIFEINYNVFNLRA